MQLSLVSPWLMSKRLPDSVQQVAEVIGEAAALELVRRWPRTKTNGDVPFRIVLYVPTRLAPDHRLVAILGWGNAEKLARVFGGEIIFLATCANVSRSDRDEEIAKALSAHASPAAIAARFGISERHVRRIASKLRADKSAMGTRSMRADHAPVNHRAIAA
jgi:hypothetical protein